MDKIKVEYKGKTYMVEMMDFVNKRVGFSMLNHELKKEGVHVDFNKVSFSLKDRRADKLYKLLESIDNLPDMVHPETAEGHEKCWKMMVKRAETRDEVMSELLT